MSSAPLTPPDYSKDSSEGDNLSHVPCDEKRAEIYGVNEYHDRPWNKTGLGTIAHMLIT